MLNSITPEVRNRKRGLRAFYYKSSLQEFDSWQKQLPLQLIQKFGMLLLLFFVDVIMLHSVYLLKKVEAHCNLQVMYLIQFKSGT